MKFNPTQIQKNPGRSMLFIAMLYVAVSLSSCIHHDDVQGPEYIAALAVTNASPTRNSVDFYIDNQKVNSSAPLLFGNTLGYSIGYFRAVPGTRSGTVTNSGVSTSVYTGKFNLENQRYHSLFILSGGAQDTVSFLTIKDDFSTPPAGKAQVRFINLSSDSPAYSLEVEGDTTAFNNIAYRSFTAYKNVAAKTGVNLNLRNTATNQVVASLSNVELKNRVVYTVWAKGLITTAVDSQKVALKLNFNFNDN